MPGTEFVNPPPQWSAAPLLQLLGAFTQDLRYSLLKVIHWKENHKERLGSGILRAISDQRNTSTTISRERHPASPTPTRSRKSRAWDLGEWDALTFYGWIESSYLRTRAEVQLSLLSQETGQTRPQGTNPQRTDNQLFQREGRFLTHTPGRNPWRRCPLCSLASWPHTWLLGCEWLSVGT